MMLWWTWGGVMLWWWWRRWWWCDVMVEELVKRHLDGTMAMRGRAWARARVSVHVCVSICGTICVRAHVCVCARAVCVFLRYYPPARTGGGGPHLVPLRAGALEPIVVRTQTRDLWRWAAAVWQRRRWWWRWVTNAKIHFSLLALLCSPDGGP